MINLKKELLIGRGDKRSCYQHPDESNFCIKIIHTEEKKTYRKTIREINYTKKYESRIRLPRYCGSINTNLGKGYIFERIKDWDGKTSVTLKKYCENGVEQNYIQELLYKMYNSLLINRIQVSDFHSGNILVNYKTPDAEPNLVIIDGIGNSDYIKLCNFSKFLLKKKLIRKFKKLMAKLDIPNPYIH